MLNVLLGKDTSRYFEAGDHIVRQGDAFTRKTFETVLAGNDRLVRTRVERLGLCLEKLVREDKDGTWIPFFADKLGVEDRPGVALELIWRCVHLAPSLEGDVRDGTLFAVVFFDALRRFDHKGFRSEASRAASYVGGPAFDTALHVFVNGLPREDRRKFQTLVRLAAARTETSTAPRAVSVRQRVEELVRGGADRAEAIETVRRTFQAAAQRCFEPGRSIEAVYDESSGIMLLYLVVKVVEQVRHPGREVSIDAPEIADFGTAVGEELLFQVFYRDEDADMARSFEQGHAGLLSLREDYQRSLEAWRQIASDVLSDAR